jgi:hypothetical protein
MVISWLLGFITVLYILYIYIYAWILVRVMTAWLSQLISPNSSRWWQAAFAQVCDCFAVLHFCFFCKEFPSCFAHRILAPEKTVRWILEASDCPLLLSSLCRLPKVACKQGNPHLAANVVGKIGDLRAPEAFTQWAVNVDSYWCWIPHVQIAAVLWSVTILRPGDFLFDL